MTLYRSGFFVVIAFCFISGFGAGQALARPALVFEVNSGRVLHAEDAGMSWHPASLTKIMTAYIVFGELSSGRLKEKQKLKVSKFAASQQPSKMGVPAGKTVTVRRALRALAIRSANDMAVVLAEAVSGSEKAFAIKMNKVAKQLGMSGTHFVNAHGLPEAEQVTTARDMGILAQAIFRQYPKRSRVFAEKYLQWGKKKLRNRNRLLKSFKGADGLKTGFICASGFNLVASATRGGKRLIVVVLGAPTGRYRFDAAALLLEKGFSQKFTKLRFKKKLAALANKKPRKKTINLRQDICEKQQVATFTKPENLKGWGILFGVYKTSKSARRVLNNSIANLRGAVRGAQAAVLKGKQKNRHGALLAGLSMKELRYACNWLSKAGASCVRVSPKRIRKPAALWR